MDNDMIPSPLSARTAVYGADDFLLVGGVIFIVLSGIFILPSSLLMDQSAFATFPGENGKIAFMSNYEIYVMNADGTGQTRLTNNDAYDYDPSWSPDGEKITFTSTRDGGGLYVMNAD